MNEQPDRPHGRRQDANDPERSLVSALRWSLLPGMCLPLTLASLGVSATGAGLPVALAVALAGLALIANFVCWRKVIARWRSLPRPDDEDHGWPRWWEDEDPQPDPSGGPGGFKIDWTKFEREFWAHVTAQARQRQLEPIRA
jgi:hypothetical protein